jgi:hypothetical protein
MRLSRFVVVLAALSFVSVAGCKKADPAADSKGKAELAGAYTIVSATDASTGSSYRGSAVVAKKSGFYTIDWKVDGNPPYAGVALQNGTVLGVGWGKGGGTYGVVVYEIDGGKLHGKWVAGGSDFVGTENLEGPASLNGVYKITSATTASGQGYTGQVTISNVGPSYKVEWKLPNDTYSGMAMRKGNLLVVGWGKGGTGAGVIVYTHSATTLTGQWVTPGANLMGTEVLTAR